MDEKFFTLFYTSAFAKFSRKNQKTFDFRDMVTDEDILVVINNETQDLYFGVFKGYSGVTESENTHVIACQYQVEPFDKPITQYFMNDTGVAASNKNIRIIPFDVAFRFHKEKGLLR